MWPSQLLSNESFAHARFHSFHVISVLQQTAEAFNDKLELTITSFSIPLAATPLLSSYTAVSPPYLAFVISH